MRTPSLLLAYFRWSIVYKIYHFSKKHSLFCFSKTFLIISKEEKIPKWHIDLYSYALI